MSSHEIFVEAQCFKCPLTIDGKLGWCPVAYLHLANFEELSDDVKKALFADDECSMRKVIETTTMRKVLPGQKTLPGM